MANKSRPEVFHLRLSTELKDWVAKRAEETDTNMTWFINQVLREAKERDEQERKP